MDSLKITAKRLKKAVQSRRGQRLLKALRLVFILGVVVWLAYQLSDIGWRDVWASRPTTPWFYVTWLGLYLQLPLIEALIYRALWGLPVREGLPPILRKRALNQDVVSYSGEAYFFVWAQQRLSLSGREIGGALKDNAIASSLATWASAVLLIGAFLFAGQIVLTDLIGNQNPLYIATGVALAAVLIGLGAAFRRTLFTLPMRAVGALFAVHLGRFLAIVYVLQILQWWVVLPEAPFSVWATMLAVLTITNRIPLIPAKDLIGVGAVLGMSQYLAASEAVLGAMLLTRIALDKALNLILFVLTNVWERTAAPVEQRASSGEQVKTNIPMSEQVDADSVEKPVSASAESS